MLTNLDGSITLVRRKHMCNIASYHVMVEEIVMVEEMVMVKEMVIVVEIVMMV